MLLERRQCERCLTPQQILLHNNRIIEVMKELKRLRRRNWFHETRKLNAERVKMGLRRIRRPYKEKKCGTCRFLASEGEDGGVTVEMVEDEVGRRQVRVRYVDWSSPVTQACLVCLDLYLDFLHPRHKQNITTPPAC